MRTAVSLGQWQPQTAVSPLSRVDPAICVTSFHQNNSKLLGPINVAKPLKLMNREKPRKNSLLLRWGQSSLSSASSTQHTGSCWLGNAQQFCHNMRGEGGSRFTRKLKQGAHIHQPMDWPLPHACAQPYRAGSGSHGQLFPLTGAHQHGKPSVSDRGKPGPFNCQLHTTHVGVVGWEPHGSSPTTCARKADHEFGVCVPLAFICLWTIVN